MRRSGFNTAPNHIQNKRIRRLLINWFALAIYTAIFIAGISPGGIKNDWGSWLLFGFASITYIMTMGRDMFADEHLDGPNVLDTAIVDVVESGGGSGR